MLTKRTTVALAAGTVVWYWCTRHLPWPAPGTVPVLDLVELRNPVAWTLFRLWWWLAPFASGSVLAAAILNAWHVWGPPARRQAARKGRLPPDPFQADAPEISLTVGELHHPLEPREDPSPRWLSLPARGLYTGICVVGAIGSGKTSACLHPFAQQLLGWQARDPARRASALVLEVKGDFCFAVRRILADHDRDEDYLELSLDGDWAWNPLHEPQIDSYSLAHSIGSLLNQLFGKGKDPFWQQAYTAVVRAAIELHRLEAEPWFTLQDVYRLAIAPDGFRDRLEAAEERIPSEWAGGHAPPAPVTRARIGADAFAAHIDALSDREWQRVDGDLETPAGPADFDALERILGHRPACIQPAATLGPDAGPADPEERRRLRLRLEALQRWHRDDWERLDPKLRTSVVEGLSSFLSLFDQPEVADAFCPPRDRPHGGRRLLPAMEELVEGGRVLALNLPAGTNAALARVLGALLKQCWLQALLRRPAKMADPAHRSTIWRPALFLCDEYHSFATVGGDDPGGDERAFALSRQSLCIPLVATQSLSSLRSATGGRDDWRTLLQTLRTKIFLSLEDEFSQQEASRLCGQSEFLKPNYSFSESANRAGVSLLSGRAGGDRGSLSASRSYGPRLEAKFKPREFRELDNAQAIVLPFDGVRPLPATRAYLKPWYLPRDENWFRQREEGRL